MPETFSPNNLYEVRPRK